jgi:hypothetical protein
LPAWTTGLTLLPVGYPVRSADRVPGIDETRCQGKEREEEALSAKHKLNAAHWCGCLLVAGLFGWLTGSWIVFGVALAALLIAAYHAGDIRQ